MQLLAVRTGPTGHYQTQYDGLWHRLQGTQNPHEAAVGGDFETVGRLEFELLKSLGLQAYSTVVDVGCGSGRLATQLARWLLGDYLGTDILPALLERARDLCRRPEWRFVQTDGQTIPAENERADFVCAFSVFTHIAHEETWRYMLEAKRVLRPGGKLICSFLDFRIPSHWAIFRDDVVDFAPDKILNQSLSRDALAAFAGNAGLKLEAFFDGDKPHIPIPSELVFDSGHRVAGLASLGQSVCVLQKPLSEVGPAR